MADSTDDPALRYGEMVEISNEFSSVRITKVWTRNGERLEISSPRTDQHIRLDALELESLTWQTTETFSNFLQQPFGPEDH